MSLVDELKKIKEKKSLTDKVLVQNVEWDLDPSFIGEPMVPRILKRLSQYVDKKLMDYSSIYGANPATNMPKAILSYGDEPTLNLNNVQLGHNPERPVDVVDGDELDEDDFPTGNATRVTRETPPNPLIRVHPGVRTREELAARVRNDEGFIVDDPDLFDPSENWMVRQHLRQTADASVIEDEHVASEMKDTQPIPIGKIDSLISSEIRIPPESSLYGQDAFQVPAEDRDILHGQNMDFSEVVQRSITEGRQVEGISPLNFRLEENVNNGAEGFDPTRENVDNHVYAHGALPGVRLRVRDSFIRNRHLTLQVPQYDLMGPGSGGKNIAYVTSYTIEHQTPKIKARVITAPPTLTLDDELWFELCCNGGRNTLGDMIRSTVKANLCVLTKSRSDKFGQISESEKTALETLRDMITEQEFRHYLRYGFLSVKGSSGHTYQIFRDRSHTKVWKRGKVMEEVCVRIRDRSVPSTDNIIAFKTMIETNEDMFKALGNVYKMKRIT